MPQSLARLPLHWVFSTKNRLPWLPEGIRAPVHAYLAATLKDIDCLTGLIKSVQNRVFIPLALGRTTALTTAVEQL